MPFRRSRLAAALLFLGAGAVAQTPGQPAAAAPLPAAHYSYATGAERFRWYAGATVGPVSVLVAGPVSAGWSTLFNRPEEYGPHWEGFGKRYRDRMAAAATGNAIEALSGAALGEDPRYIPAVPGTPFGGRVKRIIRTTFTAYRPDGTERFSYARLAGNVGGNFISNAWRVGSASSAGDAALRCVWGVTSRMTGNAFAEFVPEVLRKLRRK